MGQTYIFTNCDFVKIYKNGEYKSTAYPARDKFPHLPHPPVLPRDFIGDSLEKDEGLDPKTAAALKDALVTAGVQGFLLPPKYYAKAVYALLHGRMSFGKIFGIVTKYFANWGQEQITYRFDGYKDGELVKSVTRTAVTELTLSAKADCATLKEGATYDVTRVELLALDQNGNRVPFANNAVSVTVEGPAKVIGPDSFALIGGARAFWVRTVGKKGAIRLRISGEGFPEQTVSLTAE